MSIVQAIPADGAFLNVDNFLFKPGIVGGFGIQIANGSQTFGTGQLFFRGSTISPFGSVGMLSPLHLASDPSISGAASPYAIFYDTDLAPGNYVGGMITDNGNVDVTAGTFIWALLSENRVYRMAVNPGFAAFTLFNALGAIQNNGNFNLLSAIILNNGMRYTRNTSGTSVAPALYTAQHAPTMNPSVTGAVLTFTDQAGMVFSPRWNMPAAGSTLNMGTLRGLLCTEPAVALFGSSSGTRNFTAYYGIDFPNFTTFTGTQVISVINSNLAAGTNRRFLNHLGTALSFLGGGLTLANTAALTFGTASAVALDRVAANVLRFLGNAEDLRLTFAANLITASSTTGASLRFSLPVDINAPVALGGGAAATLGTIGGAGPTAAAQQEWVQILVNGNVRWIPAWT